MGCSCNVCINTSVTCTWPPRERQACFECTQWHDKCLVDGELVTQHAPCGSRPKKRKARVVAQPIIKEVTEETAVEELTGKDVMPEEASIEVAALEEVPVVNMPPCLEELVWVTLQEVCKKRESLERCEHFEYGLWEEMHKLVTLKGREVASAQGNVALAGAMQGNVMVGKSWVQEEGKRKAREPERKRRLWCKSR